MHAMQAMQSEFYPSPSFSFCVRRRAEQEEEDEEVEGAAVKVGVCKTTQ
jgi:hypothetical protein